MKIKTRRSFMNSVPPESGQNQGSSRSHNEAISQLPHKDGTAFMFPSPAWGLKKHRNQEMVPLFKNTIIN